MPPTKAQAEKERRGAAQDVQRDGARVTIVYDGAPVDPATGERDPAARREVKTYAVIGGYRVGLIDGQRVRSGDQRVLVADSTLAGLSLSALREVADEGVTTGYWLYTGGDRERHPETREPLAEGVRRMAVIALENTVYVGGYPVLRVLQARG